MISNLQYITQDSEHYTHTQLAKRACEAGANWIQLRVKNKPEEEWKAIALETLALCKKHSATLIINDNVLLAKEIGAHGVHLGKEDMSIAEARNLLGGDFIIGATANTFEDIKNHAADKADYIGLGPFAFTTTKQNLSPVLGIDGYKNILQQCKNENITIPIIAIGGIAESDMEEILSTGIYGVAASGAITNALNIKITIANFYLALEQSTIQKNESKTNYIG